MQAGSLTIPGNLNVTGSFNYLPKGTIVAYNQTSAPSGWTLCDGSNSSPDLRNRFILGWGNRGIGTTGGAETVTLNVNQMPQHNHGASVSDPGHDHGFYGSYHDHGPAPKLHLAKWQGAPVTQVSKATTGISVGISHSGGNQAHENMPPFYVLTYIMKL